MIGFTGIYTRLWDYSAHPFLCHFPSPPSLLYRTKGNREMLSLRKSLRGETRVSGGQGRSPREPRTGTGKVLNLASLSLYEDKEGLEEGDKEVIRFPTEEAFSFPGFEVRLAPSWSNLPRLVERVSLHDLSIT